VIKPKETGIACEKCGKPMVIKGSRRGPFLACSGYPKCRNAKNLPPELQEPPKETGEKCEQCGEPMVLKTSRWGKEFLACSAYPKCKNARNVGAPVEAAAEKAPETAEPAESADEAVTSQSDD
jgi:DNA topoisomerase-1